MRKFKPIYLIALLPIIFILANYYKTTWWDKNNTWQYTDEQITYLCDYEEDQNPYVLHFNKQTLKEKERYIYSKTMYDDTGQPHNDMTKGNAYHNDFEIIFIIDSWGYILDRITLDIKKRYNLPDQEELNCELYDVSYKAFEIITKIMNERKTLYQKRLNERKF